MAGMVRILGEGSVYENGGGTDAPGRQNPTGSRRNSAANCAGNLERKILK
jgi:hypothetical protein